MAPATAEKLQTPYWEPELVEQLPQLPLVINVAEMMEDQLVRNRAERFIHFVGSQVTNKHIEEIPRAPRPTSLMDMIHQAAAGNELALRGVIMNVHTDVVERTLKAGHVSVPIEMEEAGDGSIVQNTQSLQDIQANNHLYASDISEMQLRSKAEANNIFRLENANRMGLLEDYWFVERSRPADDMSPEAAKKAGFFIDTMTVGLRGTTKQNGKIVMQPAVVAGKRDINAPRHDEEAIVQVDAVFGVDSTGKTATEILDSPLLIHKSLMPNGIIDLVALYDRALGDTFFGEDKPRQEYLAYREECYERERNFEPTVQKIVADLLEESNSIIAPKQAIERLNKLSGKHMIELAVLDRTIDANVFGPASAHHVRVARQEITHGNFEQARIEINQAVQKDESRSCPSGAGASNSSNGGAEGSSGEGGGDSDEHGSLEFECPHCHRTNRRTPGTLLTNCQKCGGDVRC